MQRCPSCRAEYPDELDGCPECDGDLAACSRCGAEHGGDACPVCGTAAAPLTCGQHPEAEAVGRCVLCRRAVCDACRAADRRVHLCAEHAGVPIIEGWAQVYTTGSEFEAQLVRENLRAEGVEAQVFSQRDVMFSLDLGDLSIVRVLVPVWDYETALSLIRHHTDAEGEVAFACPRCGEAYDPGATGCAACGAALA